MINAGYRSLVAAILKQAAVDATTITREVEEFTNSDWCEKLCDFIEIPYIDYRNLLIDRINKRRQKQAEYDKRRKQRAKIGV